MPTPRDVLTPDALAMLQTIAASGSFAAAARSLGLVPSALTYRVRQIEDALDVLLFDRSSRQAQLTVAGTELLREAGRPTLLILDDALVHSDEQRLAQMKRVVFDAAQRHQLLLFTCHPSAWRDMGVPVRDLMAARQNLR